MVKVTAKVRVEASVLERAKTLLRGAPEKVHAHRLSVGIHEQEASAQAVQVASRKPKTNAPKTSYVGKPAGAFLIDVALFHEFGTRHSPERSWLRSWFDRNLDRIKEEASAAVHAEYAGDKSAVTGLASRWGLELRAWISDDIAKLAPLSEETKAERRAAGLAEEPPLYATHQLVEAIHALADGRYEL